jgi:hypothetical protein
LQVPGISRVGRHDDWRVLVSGSGNVKQGVGLSVLELRPA